MGNHEAASCNICYMQNLRQCSAKSFGAVSAPRSRLPEFQCCRAATSWFNWGRRWPHCPVWRKGADAPSHSFLSPQDPAIWQAISHSALSSSAYQIEGATHEDGRGDRHLGCFLRRAWPHLHRPDRNSIACDHYHRMPAKILTWWKRQASGITAFRSPGRGCFRNGDSQAKPKRLRLLRPPARPAAGSNGIAPWLCLYHWDLPQALQEKGGWTNRDTAYPVLPNSARRISRVFGDRVSHWMVMNEIATHSMLGYGVGTHAPGQLGAGSWLSALHHLNLGQGLGIQALRAANVKGRIGTIACCEPIRPVSQNKADQAAANLFDGLWNGAVLDPLYTGRYPENRRTLFRAVLPEWRPGQYPAEDRPAGRELLQPALPAGRSRAARWESISVPALLLRTYTAMGWPIEPDGLYEMLMRIAKNSYGAPECFVSENGFATVDKTVSPDTFERSTAASSSFPII